MTPEQGRFGLNHRESPSEGSCILQLRNRPSQKTTVPHLALQAGVKRLSVRPILRAVMCRSIRGTACRGLAILVSFDHASYSLRATLTIDDSGHCSPSIAQRLRINPTISPIRGSFRDQNPFEARCPAAGGKIHDASRAPSHGNRPIASRNSA